MKIKLGLGDAGMGEAALYCGGRLCGEDRRFSHVCTDSREADGGTLFVATRGERVDGHTFIKKAQESGCNTFLCEYIPDDADKNSSFCVVEDSLAAFSSLAKGYRQRGHIDTVAITGSVGKTTTKELTFCVLSEGRNVYHTKGNFNSVIGMPMSLMEVGSECDAAVFEMGMSGFGEIHAMSMTACPVLAMITNIGSSHLEYLGTRENIARAKFEIADGLMPSGVLLLNGDEVLLRDLASEGTHDYRVMYASMCSNGDFCAENVRFADGGSYFDVTYENLTIKDIFVPAVGNHIVHDALFAAAAGILFGIDGESIKSGLKKYTPEGFRQRIYEKEGITVISDCYNAAPESVRCALDVLASVECKRRIAVLGDMKELGEGTERMHESVGEYLAKKGIDLLFSVGELAEHIARGAVASGMDEGNVMSFLNADAGADALKNTLCCGDAVLFKASRSMRFEEIIEKVI